MYVHAREAWPAGGAAVRTDGDVPGAVPRFVRVGALGSSWVGCVGTARAVPRQQQQQHIGARREEAAVSSVRYPEVHNGAWVADRAADDAS